MSTKEKILWLQIMFVVKFMNEWYYLHSRRDPRKRKQMPSKELKRTNGVVTNQESGKT